MKKWILGISFIIFVYVVLSIFNNIILMASTSVSIFSWNEAADGLSDVQLYTYKYYLDGSLVPISLTNVNCIGSTSPFQCSVNFPTFYNGSHSLTLTASNTAGESLKSNKFMFQCRRRIGCYQK